MNKRIKKQFWVSPDENEMIRIKAEQCCYSESALFRSLINGFEPKEAPSQQFHEDMKVLSMVGNNLNQLVKNAYMLGVVNTDELQNEIAEIRRLRLLLLEKYLTPEKVDEDGSI